MDKKELGKKITELIRNEDKERTVKLINDISAYNSEFSRNHLKFETPSMERLYLSGQKN